jgi:hypothetical protein
MQRHVRRSRVGSRRCTTSVLIVGQALHGGGEAALVELVDERLESLLGVAFIDGVVERLPVSVLDALVLGQLGVQVARCTQGKSCLTAANSSGLGARLAPFDGGHRHRTEAWLRDAHLRTHRQRRADDDSPPAQERRPQRRGRAVVTTQP